MQRRRLIGGIAAGIALVLILTGIGLLVTRVVQSRDDVPLAAPPTPANSSTPWGPITGSPAATTAPPGSDLNGPLDLLIVGIDTRVTIPDWQPHADAIMLMHVPAGLDKGYLLSLPRDLLVDVPAFPKANFRGGRMKLTEAMSRGSRVPGKSKADVRQGYELLSRTIAGYTGIKDFDAGAVLTFTGLSRLTDALGGVTLKIDQKVVSQHIRPDGRHRAARAGGGGRLRPAALYGRWRLHPSAPPAAAHQGAADRGDRGGPGHRPGEAGCCAAGARRHPGLRRQGADTGGIRARAA
jgi:hypothetical protein